MPNLQSKLSSPVSQVVDDTAVFTITEDYKAQAGAYIAGIKEERFNAMLEASTPKKVASKATARLAQSLEHYGEIYIDYRLGRKSQHDVDDAGVKVSEVLGSATGAVVTEKLRQMADDEITKVVGRQVS